MGRNWENLGEILWDSDILAGVVATQICVLFANPEKNDPFLTVAYFSIGLVRGRYIYI